MKRIAIALGIVVSLVAALGISQLVASESGEVVVLTTKDAAGNKVQTRVWIVEHDGGVWLRSGQPGSGWHQRIESNPEVDVERGEVSVAYRAEPTPDLRDAINGLMRTKYGWADWYIDALFGVSDAVPIQLVPPATPASEATPQITFGNGEANWIVTEGATRDGATFSFREVQIDGNGWLVMHPFKDGKPVGEVYVGATYVSDGDNRDVRISVDPPPATGEMFLVMLHRDVNENQEFDFVFVDERNVLDKAVFEGTTMIAHPFAAP